LEKDKEDLSKVGQALMLAQSRENPDEARVAKLQEQFDRLYDDILTKTGAAPAAPAPAPTQESGSTKAPASQRAPIQDPGPGAALQEAEIVIAANAIVKATDGKVTPERLASMPQDQQLMVLGGVVDQLIAQQAPEAEILAVQGVIDAVQQQSSAATRTVVPAPAPTRSAQVENPVQNDGPSYASQLINEVATRLPEMPSMPETPGLTRISDAISSLRGAAQPQPAAPVQERTPTQPAREVRAQANQAMTSFLARPQTAMQNPEAFMQALDVLEASLPPNHPVLRQAQDLAVQINAQMLQRGR
jgi:hypothetical protein